MCRSSGEENCAASGTFVRSRNRPGSRYNNLMMPCSAAAERGLSKRMLRPGGCIAVAGRSRSRSCALRARLIRRLRWRCTSSVTTGAGIPAVSATRMAYTSRSTLPGSSATTPAASLTKATRCSSMLRSYFRCTAPRR